MNLPNNFWLNVRWWFIAAYAVAALIVISPFYLVYCRIRYGTWLPD